MRKKEKSIGAAMYSFTGRVFPPMRRPLHLILHHLAVHLNVSTGGNLPPQLSDAGCERLYLLRIISRGSFTLSAIERLTLRCKSVIFSLQIFFVSQQFVKRCDLPFPQKVTLPPVAIVLQEIIAQQVIAPLADFAFIYSNAPSLRILPGVSGCTTKPPAMMIS